MDSTEPRPPPRVLSPPYAGPCPPGARRISRASGDRLPLHTGAIWMVVASAGTMSHFTDYLPGLDHELDCWRCMAMYRTRLSRYFLYVAISRTAETTVSGASSSI